MAEAATSAEPQQASQEASRPDEEGPWPVEDPLSPAAVAVDADTTQEPSAGSVSLTSPGEDEANQATTDDQPVVPDTAAEAPIGGGAGPAALDGVREAPLPERCVFSGLRLENRTRAYDSLVNEKDRFKFCTFDRIPTELAKRSQNDMKGKMPRLLVGVVHDISVEQKLATGALYKCWSLTDLQQPEPREVVVHIMGQAFHYFSQKNMGRQEVREPTRGEVVALCNAVYVPVDLENSANRRSSNKVAVRIVGPDQVRRFGKCPTLGRCDMRGCKRPCNKDLRERFCAAHLCAVYHEKALRMTTGGQMSSGGHTEKVTKLMAQAKALAKRPTKKTEVKPAKQVTQDPKLAAERKVETAFALEKRRLDRRSSTNNDYIRSVQFGAPKDGVDTSLIPELGRGLEHRDGLEMDMEYVSSNEQKKAQRMLSRRTEEKQNLSEREAQGAPAREAVDCPPAAKRPRAAIAGVAADGETVPVKNLGDLMRTKLKARRAGATPAKADDGAPSSGTDVGSWRALKVDNRARDLMQAIREGQQAAQDIAQAATASTSAAAPSAGSRAAAAAPANPFSPEQERVKRLEAELHNTLFRPDRLLALLSECSTFFSVNGYDQGLYNTTGILSMTPGIPAESKHALMTARRRWRALAELSKATAPPAQSLAAIPIGDAETAPKAEAAPEASMPTAPAEAQCPTVEAQQATATSIPSQDQPPKELAASEPPEASDAPVGGA